MELIKLEINNYKSIKEPIVINFNGNLPLIFIGKNGSGKTNILEAINAIAEANSTNRYYGKNINFNYKAYIQLNEEDLKNILPNEKFDKKNTTIIASSNGQNLKIDRILSKDFVTKLKKEFQDINKLANELEKEFDNYKKILFNISPDEQKESFIHLFQIKNNNGGLTNFTALNSKINNNINHIRKIINQISPSFSEDETFIFNNQLPIYNHFIDFDFKLEYVKPPFAPFEKKYIKIDQESIKKEIEEINLKTEKICKNINEIIHKLNKKYNLIKNNYESEYFKMQQKYNNYEGFIQKINQIICKNCTFLKNENSDVIFKSQKIYNNYYHNNSQLIITTYIKQVYNGEDKEDILNDLNKKSLSEWGEPQKLDNFRRFTSEKDLKEFENYLNNNVPEFDKNMFYKISIEYNNNNDIKILLHEKTNEVIDLDNTSSGRRWYFTFYFMKSVLNKGDMFIIDEPATMLHPIAQKEILNELMHLSQKGIKVIYSTHSPYLVSKENWRSVNFVSLKNSTKITNFDSKDKYIISMQNIDDDIFSWQELIEEFNYNIEEITRKCYELISQKNKNLTIEKNIENLESEKDIKSSTIKAWNKNNNNFRKISLENLIKVSEYMGIDIKNLILNTNNLK